jgi:hypothetical protein
VSGRQPELWNAVTGERRDLPEWSEADGRTRLPLRLAAYESGFIVFRRPAAAAAPGARNFPARQAVATLPAAWEVSFAGQPQPRHFAALADWTKQAEPELKYFSGRAVYRQRVTLPGPRPAGRLWLDLGAVHDLAVVRVNGRALGTVWTAPWGVDVSSAWQDGENLVEIEIVTSWNNRLVGDAALPPAQRHTQLYSETVTADAPLLPAGLLGPVTLQVEQ